MIYYKVKLDIFPGCPSQKSTSGESTLTVIQVFTAGHTNLRTFNLIFSANDRYNKESKRCVKLGWTFLLAIPSRFAISNLIRDMFKVVLKFPDKQKPKFKMNRNVCQRAGIVTRINFFYNILSKLGLQILESLRGISKL